MSAKRIISGIAALFLLLVLASAAPAFAAALSKPSPVGPRAIGMGGAFVAVADDLSAIYYNPAGLTQLKGTNLSLGIDSTIPGMRYHPYTPLDPSGSNLSSEHAEWEFLPAPNLGFSTDYFQRVTLGLGVYLPYANGGKFDTPSKAVLNPLDGRIYGLEISPALAIKLHDLVSFGAGFRVMQVKSEINGQLIPPLPQYGPLGGNYANLDTDGRGYGGSAGLLIGPWENWSVGVSYRSQMKAKLSGDFILKDAAGNQLAKNDAKLNIQFPNQVRAGVAYQVTEDWLLAGQFDWTQYSQIKNLNVTIGGNTVFPVDASYQNAYTAHLGARHHFSPAWIGSAGYTYDTSSIPDKTNNRITGDVNAHEVALGVTWERVKHAIDLSYNLRFGGRTVPVVDGSGNPNPTPGRYYGYVSSVSLAWRFYFN